MNSYQKLKAENLKLRQQLDTLANEPDSDNGLLIKTLWRMNRKTESYIMSGNPTNDNDTTTQGILNQTTNQ